MRTLALLAALLLLAVQAHSATLPEPAEEVPNQSQPEDWEMDISFSGPGSSALRDAGLAQSPMQCRCTSGSCGSREFLLGICYEGPRIFNFCCRRL
ncbi:PREDICTED: defensin-5-like [Dipodomys ordii]|uniref:Defensin-5-like n=1 Tax=Dipodomys ordii TaxID=10020 RepID=A0A1S3FT00_DIPOR|nr:PREDICTED: defensin-5-like [Dipodomys ordii]